MREYFSERELGKKQPNTEEINLNVYNGIITLFKKYKKNFAKDFPEFCSDPGDLICGVDSGSLIAAIQAIVPGLNSSVRILYEEKYVPNKYDVLDFVEFCYDKITDYEEGRYHSYYRHYHLSFSDDTQNKDEFRDEINKLFERNRIIFYLDENGMVKRHLPIGLENIVNNFYVNTDDERLNELISFSIEKISNPKESDHILALEKIWDAFERLKTFYIEKNKKKSVEQLIQEISGSTEGYNELLDDEFRELTRIGNSYQIRHFEKDKIQINNFNQIDYLFYRMIALIDLCITSLNL